MKKKLEIATKKNLQHDFPLSSTNRKKLEFVAKKKIPQYTQ